MRAPAPGSQRLARVASQAGLFLLALLTAKEPGTLLLAAPIAICGLVAAARNDNAEVDAIDVYWLLSTLFFVVRPAQTLVGNAVTLFAARAPFHYDAEIVLLTFAALYTFSIIMVLLLPASGRPVRPVEGTPGAGLLLGGAIVGFALTVAFNGDIGNLLAARYDKQAEQISPLMAVGKGLLIASVAMLTAAFAANRQRRAMDVLALLIGLSLLVLVFNPASSSRYGLIGAWLPIGLIGLPVLRRPAVFAASTLVAIVVAMPILSVTTRFGWNLDRVLNSRERGSIGEIPYIDTFDTLLHGVHYAHEYGFQYGAKILSILVCFVPRAWWPEKPVVSGLDIGHDLFSQGFVGTPNLSMPIVGDFYMDFGLIGVAAGTVVVALACRGLLRVQPVVGGVPVFGYLCIAALPILVRGAVGAVILLAACALLWCAVLTMLSHRRAAAGHEVAA